VIWSHTNVVYQAQHHGTGGNLPAQSVTTDQRSRTSGGRARPICVYCDKEFRRVQELKRHLKDIHMPRRGCPFCPFMWTRPGQIKAHLIADHAEQFTAEVLEGIKALCGRRVIEFVDAYDHVRDVEATSPLAIPLPVFRWSSVPVSPGTTPTPFRNATTPVPQYLATTSIQHSARGNVLWDVVGSS